MESLLLAIALASALGASASITHVPAPKPVIQQKVWANEDVEALRDRGLISIIGEESPTEPAGADESGSGPVSRLPKELDPEWYLERLAEPRAALAQVEEQLASLRRNLACRCTPEGGLSVARPSAGITPESGLWLLEQRARELRAAIASIEDEALRHGLAPGLFR